MALWFWIIVLIIASILLISVLGIVFAVSGGIIGFFVIKFIVEYLYRKEMKGYNDKLSSYDNGKQCLFRLSEYLGKFKLKNTSCCNSKDTEIFNVAKSVKDKELAELICYIHAVECELVIRPVSAELTDNPEENDIFLESNDSIMLLNERRKNKEIEDIVSSIKREDTINPFSLRKINPYQNYNIYEDFQKSCTEFGVSVHPQTNLYNLLLALKRKKLHFELTKDGYVEYNLSEKHPSTVDVEKWEKIIFSSEISSEDLCLCLRCIFLTHGIFSIEHSKYRQLINFLDWRTQFSSNLPEY